MRSYAENIPCVYGYFWWQFRYGTGNPVFNDACFRFVDNQLSRLYVGVEGYYDLFRMRHYSQKVIRNRRELRKYLGKRYFDLTCEQLAKISEFFSKYSDGVITFG